jgi:hypothetical protein
MTKALLALATTAVLATSTSAAMINGEGCPKYDF